MSRAGLATRLLVGLASLWLSVGCGSAAPAAVSPAAATVLQQREQLPGRLLYVRDGDLWLWQAGDARQLTTGGTWSQPAFSPDGREIAYAFRETNFSDLFAMAADGSSSRRLTRGQAAAVQNNDWAFRPAWSPDGSQIAYVSDANSFFPLLWVMNADGANRRQLMTPLHGLEAADSMSWSPDGKRIAITAMGRDPSQIYLFDVEKLTIEKLTSHPNGAFDPAWSPDGETIAYVGRDNGRGDLWLRAPDGSADHRIGGLAFVRSPAWSPDGRFLAVLAATTGSFEIWVASVEHDGEAVSLGEFRQVTRDGRIDAISGLSWGK